MEFTFLKESFFRVSRVGFRSQVLVVVVSEERHFHCVKSVHIRSFSGPLFPSFGLIGYIITQKSADRAQFNLF